MRTFDSGAVRDDNSTKPDYVGYLSPLVIEAYGRYMLKHQVQADGATRGSDNWKAGIPKEEYLSSAFRHFMDWWLEAEGHESRDGLEDALCGLIFNTCGYLHEVLKERPECDNCRWNDLSEVDCRYTRGCRRAVPPMMRHLYRDRWEPKP